MKGEVVLLRLDIRLKHRSNDPRFNAPEMSFVEWREAEDILWVWNT